MTARHNCRCELRTMLVEVNLRSTEDNVTSLRCIWVQHHYVAISRLTKAAARKVRPLTTGPSGRPLTQILKFSWVQYLRAVLAEPGFRWARRLRQRTMDPITSGIVFCAVNAFNLLVVYLFIEVTDARRLRRWLIELENIDLHDVILLLRLILFYLLWREYCAVREKLQFCS